MEYLDQDIFGNPLKNWIIAFSILGVSYVLGKVIFWIFSNVLQKITAKTKNKLDDILLIKLQRPITFLVVLFAVLLAIKSLSLTKNIEVISLNITYLLFTIVITSIISKVIDTVISEVILPITENLRILLIII